jgi:Domain of unknown function (DUF4157)
MSYAACTKMSETPSFFARAPSGLRISAPDDAFEREADRIAEAVISDAARLDWSFSHTRVLPSLQRACTCGGAGTCAECNHQKELLQRASLDCRGMGTESESQAPPIVHEVLRSPGQPLDPATRAFMEPRFGHDFSHVRVHTDAKAAASARAVNAQAYTVQHHIAFGAGLYAPASGAGRRLLAHELVHTIQNQPGEISQHTVAGGREHEREANAAPDEILYPRPALRVRPLSSQLVSRQKATGSPAERRSDAELRHFAMLPYLALRNWQALSQNERDQVQWSMILLYGAPFTYEFLKYASGVKKPRPGFAGALKGPQYTPKWLFDRGYRHAYSDIWVHPSGEYIEVFEPSTKGQTEPTPASGGPTIEEPDDPELKCPTDECFGTGDTDQCKECCAKKYPDAGSLCRRYCDARCGDIL